jgi:hypothetical protein
MRMGTVRQIRVTSLTARPNMHRHAMGLEMPRFYETIVLLSLYAITLRSAQTYVLREVEAS